MRVLLGSTAKMGAGTNVQDRLIALHNLDCPWGPSDLEQHGGRIERQGNQNKEIYIKNYVTGEPLEDNVRISYPQQIKQLQAKVQAQTTDLSLTMETQEQDFAIQLQGVTFREKEKAGQTLLAISKKRKSYRNTTGHCKLSRF
ncbi:hypothetical protein HB811_09030 [Listeria booriae]|uniref:Helicase C-terminal domain-containing protein n=1 Tax=Listeria booriae TaxID=1552123 RepID=A0A841Y0E4_9LIST|nr:hypothetical protein [Listeria booriae]MBC1316917.1 hypothetical protein [Listeria booriae]